VLQPFDDLLVEIGSCKLRIPDDFRDGKASQKEFCKILQIGRKRLNHPLHIYGQFPLVLGWVELPSILLNAFRKGNGQPALIDANKFFQTGGVTIDFVFPGISLSEKVVDLSFGHPLNKSSRL
jgi:hypothetical protein